MLKQLKRVVVTGLGMVSPLGVSVESSWNALVEGKSGIIRLKDQEPYTNDLNYPDCCIAPIHKDFDKKTWQILYTNNLTNSFVMAAAHEALTDAKWFPQDDEEKNLTGVTIGILSSNIENISKSLVKVGQKNSYEQINRMMMLHVLNNMPAANISIKYQFRGPSGTPATACATSTSAIGEAFRFIQLGEANVMVTGGSEEVVCPATIFSCIKLQAMTMKKYDHPSESSRPFDAGRSGFILGEGAGVLILEELEHAKRRNAKIYAEILGYGSSADGYHLTRPEETGDGAYRAMTAALRQGDLKAEQIDSINCHATSTPAGDVSEARAIRRLLKDDDRLVNKVSITANKGAIGHLFGAAGAAETIFSIKTLQTGIVPPILNLSEPIKEVSLNFVRGSAIKQNVEMLLKNSFGFGGVNASLLIKKST